MTMKGLAYIFRNQEEIKEPVNADTNGDIPSWIRGSYVRVGPGKFDIGDITLNHYIDGYALLSKFEINNSTVTFDKRYLQSDAYKKASLAKKPILPEFSTNGNIEQKNFFSRVLNAFSSTDITDNDAINLYTIEGEVFAASETCHVHNINTDNLSTTGEKIDFYKVFGVHMATAHPKRDEKTGDLYNIGTSFTTGCKYQILKIPAVTTGSVKEAIKKAHVFATVYPSWSTCFSYYHSFAMTENFVIMVEQPLTMNVMKMAESKMKGKGIRDIMEWAPNEKNRFHIVDKRTGEVLKTKFYSENAFFYFHFINSFEEDDQLIIDIDTYPSPEVLDKMTMIRLRSGNLGEKDPAQVCRFVIPLIKNLKDVSKTDNLVRIPYSTATAFRDGDSITLSPQRLGEPGFDGVGINPTRLYKPYNYIFGTGSCLPGYYANSVCKVDIKSGDTILWRESDEQYPGEPIFIPSPDAQDEDDGVLISAVSVAKEGGRDFLLFLNAKTMKEISRASFDAQVPQALHGLWIQGKSRKETKAIKQHGGK